MKKNLFLYLTWGQNDLVHVRNFLSVLKAALFQYTIEIYSLKNFGFILKTDASFDDLKGKLKSKKVKYLFLDITNLLEAGVSGYIPDINIQELKQINFENSIINLDNILEKISKFGRKSLNKEEEAFLAAFGTTNLK